LHCSRYLLLRWSKSLKLKDSSYWRLRADAEASENARRAQVRQLENQVQRDALIEQQLNELQSKFFRLTENKRFIEIVNRSVGRG